MLIIFCSIKYGSALEIEMHALKAEMRGQKIEEKSISFKYDSAFIIKRFSLSSLWLSSVLLLGAILLNNPYELLLFWMVAVMTFLIAEIDRETMTIPFSLTTLFSLLYLTFLFYFEIHYLEYTLLLLLVLFVVSHLIISSNALGNMIGGGDVYFIAVMAAVFAGREQAQNFFVFMLVTSLVFALSNFKRRDMERPMGFALHFSSTIVLLVHLNKCI